MVDACPKCQRIFPSDAGAFCPEDATPVVPVDQVPLPSDPNDPFIGHTFKGKYQIRRTIADGGMGRVYQGWQTDTGRRIAVKVLHAHVAEEAVNIERFKREAETSLSLEHKHVIEVFDFDLEKPAPNAPDGAWFLVMEYLDGEELRAVIERQKSLPLPRVIRIVSQMAVALDRAHARGVVHRDLKPDNIFLVRTPDGDRVKLLDLGSVKLTKGQDKGQKLTVMGTTLGSPFYMSPEQARGLPDLDHRADVWAVGCIIYEMTVGVTPFNAPNGPQILFKILGEEPMPPSFAKEDAPLQLDDVMVRALDKNRDQRFQSCGELADALGHAFKLAGSHLDWATQPEAQLTVRLSMKPASSIFSNHPLPPGATLPEQDKDSPSPSSPPDDYSPVGKPPVALYAGIAGIMILLGVIALVLALR